MGQFAAQLKKLQDTVNENMTDYTPGGSGFEAIPDGEYNFAIQATLDESKEHKKLMVVFVHTVADGELEGRQVTDRCTLESKVGAQILRTRVEMLGYDWPEKIHVLEDILDEILQNVPVITAKVKSGPQKNNPEYTDTKIRWTDVVSANNTDTTPAAEEAPAEAEAEAEASDVDDVLQNVLDFCAAHDIDGVTADNTVEEIVAALKEAAIVFKAEELTDDEKALLESIDLADAIQKPAPKSKPVVKAAVKPVVKAKPVIKGRK